MGVEEQAGQVASKTVESLGERPLMFGILLLIAVFLGFSAWQQHDSADQNRQLLFKILEFRHNELMALLEQLKQEEDAANVTKKTAPSPYEP